MEKPRVLLSAYACEPDRGSEPGVGWGWAHSLARHVDVTVITRANNRTKIEAWNAGQKEETGIQFLYYDPHGWLLWLKKRRLPVNLFYLAWQWGMRRMILKRQDEFDIIHHLTFNSMMLPGLWWKTRVPVVLGPLGGTSRIRKDYKSLFGRFLLKEQLREMLIVTWNWLPWIRKSFNHAELVLCANSQTLAMIGKSYEAKTRLMLEAGIREDTLGNARDQSEDAEVRIVWIGTIEPWKAPALAIKGFAKAVEKLGDRVSCVMDIVGEGRQKDLSMKLVKDLGLEEKIVFHGWVTKDEAQRMIRDSSVLLFSSVKDTSGNVVLEAMAQGVPVICLNHQGVADITTEETAIRIEPGTIEETEKGIACAIVTLARDPALRKKMGEAGLKRIREKYIWNKKAEKVAKWYRDLSDATE